jgi:c-di-GMP-binding flagellar brake protein YcgR
MAAQKDRPVRQTDGLDRRAFPRYVVDCPVVISFLTGGAQMPGKMADLSLGGCRVITEQRFTAGIMVRIEVQFQLLGTAFRIVGVTVGSREARCFTVRFVDMPKRRRDELTEVLAEVAAVNAAKAPAAPAVEINAVAPVSSPAFANETSSAEAARVSAPKIIQDADQDADSDPASTVAARPTHLKRQTRPTERRTQRRHAVDTSARLLLVNTAISMAGRILNLSQGGCRLRTEERFTVGIYVRVEAEFYLHGLPFRLAGVSQAVMDKNTIGVRFLDMSERKREQLTELIAEIDEARTMDSPAGMARIHPVQSQGSER